MIPVASSMPTVAINFSDCETSFVTEKNHAHPAMLKLISLKVRDRQDQKEIAKLSALQINRGLMAENA